MRLNQSGHSRITGIFSEILSQCCFLFAASQRSQPVSAVAACFMGVMLLFESDFHPQSRFRSCNTISLWRDPSTNQTRLAWLLRLPTLLECFRSMASVFLMLMLLLLLLPVIAAPLTAGDIPTLLQADFSTRTLLLEHLMFTADMSVWDREHVSMKGTTYGWIFSGWNCVIDFILQHSNITRWYKI